MTAKPKKKRLVILDSHAILHRAYHALPDFSAKKSGEPTGALYGLVTMLLKITDDLKPDYIVAARDLPQPTHRHIAFAEYKGTRSKADDALVAQLKRAPDVFAAFGVPVYEAPGYEADDVIGTISEKMHGEGEIETIIATGDMDTLQLVKKGVKVYTLKKGINDTILYDDKKVQERYGFGPEHIVDYKALRGDPSDNIPGVKGIGEKTATELIVHFGTLEKIYEVLENHPEKLEKAGIKARIVTLLKEGKASAEQSKMLATIHTNVPIDFSLPDHEWDIAEHEVTALALCDELEFKSLRDRVKQKVMRSLAEKDRVAYMEKHEDAETTPSHSRHPSTGGELDADIDFTELYETSVALWLLQSDTTSPTLDDILSYAHTDDFKTAREHIFAELKKTGRLQEVYDTIEKPLMPVLDRMISTGVKLDTEVLKKLSKEYTHELEKIAGRIYAAAGHEFNINSPKQLGVVLYDELKLSTGGKQKKTAGGARTTREDELVKMAEEIEMHPPRPSGTPQEGNIIRDILAYRELQKLLSTYIDKLPLMVGEDGRLHAEFLQAGTTTGRLASANPNLQNIPIKTDYGRRIREAFVAEKGNVLVALDYSQVELRIAAGLAHDETMLKIFKEGGDIHSAVAAFVFSVPQEKVDYEMRRRAKVINFGILYGMGVNALRANLDRGVTKGDAAAYLENYFKTFSGIAAFLEKTKEEADKNGFVETLYGRRRYFGGFKSLIPGMRAQAERMAINAPMQGTEADIIKLAMIKADHLIESRGWRSKAKLVLQIHDELVYEIVKDDAKEIALAIKNVIENVVPAASRRDALNASPANEHSLHGVPIVAEIKIGKNWGEMEKGV